MEIRLWMGGRYWWRIVGVVNDSGTDNGSGNGGSASGGGSANGANVNGGGGDANGGSGNGGDGNGGDGGGGVGTGSVAAHTGASSLLGVTGLCLALVMLAMVVFWRCLSNNHWALK